MTVKTLYSICGELLVFMHVTYLTIEKVDLSMSSEECEETGVNEIWRLNQNLLAVGSTQTQRPLGIDSSAPLCLPVPRLHTHTKTCRFSYRAGIFCYLFSSRLFPTYDPNDFVKDVGRFVCGLPQWKVKSLHKHLNNRSRLMSVF